jgi:hypothetical protein
VGVLLVLVFAVAVANIVSSARGSERVLLIARALITR